MKPLTIRLVWVWLGFAALGLAFSLGVTVDLLTSTAPGEYAVVLGRLVAAVAILALWTLPLGLGAAGLLLRRRWGWALLLLHVCLGVLFWAACFYLLAPVALGAIRNHLSHGPHWGGFPGVPLQALSCLAMALFSALTAWVLLEERPSQWGTAGGSD